MAEHLIEPAELAAQLRWVEPDDRPVLLDVRWALGRGTDGNREEHRAGHLPGAAFLDLEHGLAGDPAPDGHGGRHPMPTLERATETFRAAGVREDRHVVVYDGATSLGAARAWWLLLYFGVQHVRVLNGGYAAWVEAGMPVATGEVQVTPGDVVLTPGGRGLLSAADVQDYADRHQVIDARPAARFLGEQEPIDAVAGHVPGAINVPTMTTVDQSGRFLPSDDLELLLTARGVQPERRTAVYCGSGVQACHLALAMESAEHGHLEPAVYIGSWSDWISDADRPVSTGS